jgi:hypothetical protein
LHGLRANQRKRQPAIRHKRELTQMAFQLTRSLPLRAEQTAGHLPQTQPAFAPFAQDPAV